MNTTEERKATFAVELANLKEVTDRLSKMKVRSILEDVKVIMAPLGLTFIVTDLISTYTMSFRLDIDIEDELEFTTNFADFKKLIATLAKKNNTAECWLDVDFEDLLNEASSDNTTGFLKIETKGTVVSVPISNASEFPKSVAPSNGFGLTSEACTFDCADFLNKVTKSASQLANSDMRPAMRGLLLQPDYNYGAVTIVATNGTVLSQFTYKAIFDNGEYKFLSDGQAIIDPSVVNFLKGQPKGLTDCYGVTYLAPKKKVNKKGIEEEVMETTKIGFTLTGEFKGGGDFKLTIHSQLIDETFPVYQNAFHKEPSIKLNDDGSIAEGSSGIIASKASLLEGLDIASLTANEVNKQGKFTCKDGKLLIRSEDIDLGKESETLIKKSKAFFDFEVSFNMQLFTQLLKLVDGDAAVIELVSYNKPCIIWGGENGRDDGVLLTMPLMLNSY